jgi:hypothetical protein
MTMFGSQWLANAGASYEIDQSIRFNDDDSAYLEKTYGSSESTLTAWSFSAWVKRSKLGAEQWLFAAGTASSNLEYLRFTSGDTLEYKLLLSSSLDSNVITSQVFRDPSAWMHIYAYRSSTTFNLYVNGLEVTDFSTSNAPGSSDGMFGKNVRHRIGTSYGTPSGFLGTYLAELNFVPGSAKAAADFGETNDDGVWIPKAYSGAYGTNGFYITGATAGDLGEDFSGNNNDFTSSGLATADQMSDTPTNNFSIFSPIASCNVSGQALTISDGNLRTSAGGTSNAIEAITQIGPSSGKWYAEFTLNAAPQLTNQYPVIGVIAADLNITGGNNVGNSTFRGYVPNGNTQGTGSGAYGDTFTTSDVIGCAIDLDNQKIWWSKNGTFQNSGDPAAGTNAAFTNLTAGLFYRFCISHAGSTATDVTGNFGASAFSTAAPTGFNALNTANLATPTITDGSAHFQPTLYTGTGSSQAVSQSGNSTFQPDWAWIKGRSGATEHVLTDAVRGVTKELSSNDAGIEETVAQGLTTFGSAGFTVGTDGSYNTSSATYVGWQWKANGSGSANTDGTINSTATSANTTSGFSIVKFVGNGTSGATVGHGLGVAPKMLILKDLGVAENWVIYHEAMGPTKFIYFTTIAATTASNRWNNTAPTSSVFSLGNETQVNASGRNYIVYAFAEIPGYSSFGSYTGNGSADGTFIYTGFKPAYVLMKKTSGTSDWIMYDAARDPDNFVNKRIYANQPYAEDPHASNDHVDFLSNGFKQRSAGTIINASGATYIYMAFAENPFGGDGVAPATAR